MIVNELRLKVILSCTATNVTALCVKLVSRFTEHFVDDYYKSKFSSLLAGECGSLSERQVYFVATSIQSD